MLKANGLRIKNGLAINNLMESNLRLICQEKRHHSPIRLTSFSRSASTSTSTSTSSSNANSNANSNAIRKPFVPPPTPPGHRAPSPLTPKVGTLFIALTSLAVALTATGLYQFYQSFSTWPKELRDHLRSALKAKQRGDVRRAEREFRTALSKARSLPAGILGKDPILKTTGIAIALASMLEEERQFSKAYFVYEEALKEVLQQDEFEPVASNDRVQRTPKERMRAVALAQRLGDLARLPNIDLSQENSDSTSKSASSSSSSSTSSSSPSEKLSPKDLAEKHLVWSVEELLKLSIPEETRNEILNRNQENLSNGMVSEGDAGGDGIRLSDLELPPWVTHSELGSSLESLGSFYAEKGRVDFAVPLYLQALGILLPNHNQSDPSIDSKVGKSQKGQPTVADRIRASVLMNNLGQLFIDGSSASASSSASSSSSMSRGNSISKEDLAQGKAWTEKGLDIILKTQRMTGWDNKGKSQSKLVEESDERTRVVRMECWRSEVTLLFNLGVIHEMMSDQCEARKYFQRAYQRAEEVGMRDARSRAAMALSRLHRLKV